MRSRNAPSSMIIGLRHSFRLLLLLLATMYTQTTLLRSAEMKTIRYAKTQNKI